MLKAFQVDHKLVIFADDMAEASNALKTWSSLATACGHKPGGGTVKLIADRDLDTITARELENARAKANGDASESARRRAIESLATHFASDVDFATEVVESIEAGNGRPLSAITASELGAARKTRKAA
jgi:hypothetical protein